MGMIDKRIRASAFRDRLSRAMARKSVSQSELARRIGVDRSTISQLLTDGGARLPNAHVVGACAQALGVSADWLLMLSDRPETTAEILSTSLSLAEAPRALIDDRIYAWHVEAAGYKIRHVPATLPDMLKTRAMLDWEYAPHLGRTAQQAIAAAEDRLAFMRQTRSDYEIALPIYEVETMAQATGYYRGLDRDIRAGHFAGGGDLALKQAVAGPKGGARVGVLVGEALDPPVFKLGLVAGLLAEADLSGGAGVLPHAHAEDGSAQHRVD